MIERFRMIRYLIKNNFKLMGRNIVNILLFIFAPIAVMAILISAFSGLMDKYKSVDKFKIGYSIEEGSIFESHIDSINSILSKQGIDCVKIDTDNPKECIDNNGFGGYVEYKKDIYKIHLSDDKKVEGKTFEYIISAYVENMGLAMFSNISDDKVQDMDFEFTESHPDHMPEISSTDYYGIIWIIYFSWCAILCLTGPHMIKSLKLVPMQPLDPDHADSIFKKWTLFGPVILSERQTTTNKNML